MIVLLLIVLPIRHPLLFRDIIRMTIADNTNHHLVFVLARTLKEQGFSVDKNRLQSASESVVNVNDHYLRLLKMLEVLGVLDKPEQLQAPDPAYMPLIVYHQQLGFGRIVQQLADNQWLMEQEGATHRIKASELGFVANLVLTNQHLVQKNTTFKALLRQNLLSHKSVVIEAVVASLIINFLALAVSLFSMQVYDRVIPTGNSATLVVLASGVGLVIIFEAVMKFSRAKVMDNMVVGLDQNLSRDIFERLLRVRVDQMPASVGSLAAQLRGYEQVRSFFTASTLFTLVDLPMSHFYCGDCFYRFAVDCSCASGSSVYWYYAWLKCTQKNQRHCWSGCARLLQKDRYFGGSGRGHGNHQSRGG